MDQQKEAEKWRIHENQVVPKELLAKKLCFTNRVFFLENIKQIFSCQDWHYLKK